MSGSGSQSGLGQRIVKGAAWVFAFRIAARLLGTVSTIILARLLVPADFGLIALATVFAASIDLLSSFNFEVWLIRHPAPHREHYDTVWTLSVIRGAITCVIILLLAQPVSDLFNEPRLLDVLVFVAIANAVGSFQNVGVIDFQKHLEFDKDFLFLAGTKLGAFCVTVGLAFLLRTYWALVAGYIAGKIIALILSYLIHAYRPRFSLRCWKDVLLFSKWLLASNVFGFIYTRADTFLLGKLAGTQILGLYTVAREISDLASSQLVRPIRRVLLPGYAKMSADIHTLRRGFIDGFAIIMLIGVPCAVGIGLTADPLVRVLLGPKWIESIALVQIMAVYAVASVGLANQGPVLIALGRTRLVSSLYGFGVIVLIPSFYWGTSQFGVQGGAGALSATNTIVFVVSFTATLRVLNIRLDEAIRQVWRIGVAATAMAAVVLAVQVFAETEGLVPAAILISCVVSGAIVYVGTILLSWRLCGSPEGPESAVTNYVRRWRDRTPDGAPIVAVQGDKGGE